MRASLLLLVFAVGACSSAQIATPSTAAPSPRAASGIAPDPQAEAEVLAVVNRLWEAMRTNDSSMARSVFDSTAQMVSIIDRNGARSVRWSRADGFVRAIGSAQTPWIERMVGPEVRIDGNLASVWTWYDFTVNGALSHCGYDSIELARLTEGWKIIYIADTRQQTGCQEPRVPR
jgi:hypothetical protein